jgi:hypothetical protein
MINIGIFGLNERSEILTVVLKTEYLWDMTQFVLVHSYGCFGGIYCLHLQNNPSLRKLLQNVNY